jgi:hypothetical protein
MPYLTEPLKTEVDANGGQELTSYLCTLDDKHLIGAINYFNFRLVKRIAEAKGKSYFLFAALVGTLICCVLEIYRRIIAGYEDEKRKPVSLGGNGDVL